ncbi:MAG: outer membrane beta-barrel protein [Thermoanaerobaculia bacterium]
MLHRSLPVPAFLPAILALFLSAADAGAQEADRGFSLDLFGAYITAESGGETADEESWGLRGSYRFTNTWALEAALSTVRDEGTNVYFGDLSAKAYFFHSGRVEAYLLGGAGLLAIDDLESGEGTLHLGLGAEIKLSDRAYLRPEVRGHWLAEDVGAVTFMEYSLGIGWRF